MPDDLETAVARHYGVADLTARILEALEAAGHDTAHLAPEDLAPIDEFHIGGRAATAHVVSSMRLRASDHVLDVGCGIGGAARYIAATIGCRVSGIDLTPAYIATAGELARRTGLADRVAYRVASALAMPFADRTFDAALTLHAAMNIKDRPGLYREVARVLKPGAILCIYDVMRGPGGEVRYPAAWAETAATSHLVSAADMRGLLAAAGFVVERTDDRSAWALAYLRERSAPGGASPKLGTQLMMGSNAREKAHNVKANIESGAIAPTLMLARRAG